MPTAVLKHLAKQAGKSITQAEHDWEKAKKIVRDEYKKDESDPSYWALVTGVTKKMLGLSESLTFKQFLHEGTAEGSKSLSDIAKSYKLEKTAKILKLRCSDALNAWKNHDVNIYRGDDAMLKASRNAEMCVQLDTSLTSRRSQNTANWYTIILDNNPKMEGYPQRSKSLICASSYSIASGYASIYAKFAVFPYDGTVIADTGKNDIWAVKVPAFRDIKLADVNNYAWEALLESAVAEGGYSIKDPEVVTKSFSNFKAFCEYVADLPPTVQDAIVVDMTSPVTRPKWVSEFVHDPLQFAFDAYSPQELGFKKFTTSQMVENLQHTNNEIWFSGKCIMVPVVLLDKLRELVEEKE